MTRDHTALQ